MTYQEFKPNPALLPYIDSYWTVKTDNPNSYSYKKIPNGLIDMLIILGEDFNTDEGNFVLKNEHIYLTGIKTHAVQITRQSNNHIIGISFKPAAFSSFFSFDGLSNVTNRIVELDNHFVPSFSQLKDDTKKSLNTFFLNRFDPTQNLLFPIIGNIKKHKGQIRVDELAKKYPVTIRQLERNFNTEIGLSPKEFINLTRFKFAYTTIKNKYPQKSLLDIAFECGYYDHSHLSNDIKKYTGITPTQI